MFHKVETKRSKNEFYINYCNVFTNKKGQDYLVDRHPVCIESVHNEEELKEYHLCLTALIGILNRVGRKNIKCEDIPLKEYQIKGLNVKKIEQSNMEVRFYLENGHQHDIWLDKDEMLSTNELDIVAGIHINFYSSFDNEGNECIFIIT